MSDTVGKRRPGRKQEDRAIADLKVQVRKLHEESHALAISAQDSLDQALRLARRVKRSSALTRAAFWALRASTKGWALVCDGKIVAANPAFARLGSGASFCDRWRPFDDGSSSFHAAPEGGHRSMRDLVLAESRHLDRSRDRERRRRFTNGREVIEVRAEQSQVGTGAPATLIFVDDVTQLAETQSQARAAMTALVQQERLRTAGELAIGISHDVNNLLGALALWLEPLLRDQQCRARYASNLDALGRIAEDGRQLLHKLQRVGKQEDWTIAAVDLHETVNAAIELAQGGLGDGGPERRIRFRSDLPVLPKVAGVPDELRYVFLNLFINARDAMPGGGTITVRGRVERSEVVICVEDEGTGIDPLHLSRLFDAFFTTKGERGTGIGLAMARAVLEHIGGSISARNRAAGGALFELRFVPVDRCVKDVESRLLAALPPDPERERNRSLMTTSARNALVARIPQASRTVPAVPPGLGGSAPPIEPTLRSRLRHLPARPAIAR